MEVKVNFAGELATLNEPFRPKVIARANGQSLMVARTEGEVVWHTHPDARSSVIPRATHPKPLRYSASDRTVRSGAQGPGLAVLLAPASGSRSIAHIGGEDPAWMTPMTLNPCRW